MKKKYSVAVLRQMCSVKTPRKIELPEGDITFEADDDTTRLLMEQLFPDVDKEVVKRN